VQVNALQLLAWCVRLIASAGSQQRYGSSDGNHACRVLNPFRTHMPSAAKP
jgi:hypothetical protein